MSLEHLGRLLADAADAGHATDGTTSGAELSFLAALASDPNVRSIGEVGLNAGFSAYVFLAASPAAHVVSFDLAEFTYSAPVKAYLDELFPGRHTLIAGDSTETVPRCAREWASETFDLVFIDGGHDRRVAAADLHNLRELAHRDTVVVMDDLTPWKPWGEGPTAAWNAAVEEGLVIERLLMQDGVPVDRARPADMRSRVWAVGTYRTPGRQR